MIRNRLISLLLLVFFCISGFSAEAEADEVPFNFQQAFLNAAKSLSEQQIMAKLAEPAMVDQRDLKDIPSILNADQAHEMGLIKLSQFMYSAGPFFRNYQKIIFTALLDFKRYSTNLNNPNSLKAGEEAPLLFYYVNTAGKRIPITTYSFTYLILNGLQEILNRKFTHMGSLRLHGATVKVKDFLKELSDHG